jgi:hypothetical protein
MMIQSKLIGDKDDRRRCAVRLCLRRGESAMTYRDDIEVFIAKDVESVVQN